MSKVRIGAQRFVACLVAAMVTFGVALAAVAPSTAYAGEAEVRAVGDGVFKFNWRYDGEDYSRGSCFLINDRYVLTCWHNAMFSKKELKAMQEDADIDVKELVKKFDYTVTVYRDVQKQATLVNYSEEEDWAIFRLKTKVGNSKPVTFRDSKDVLAAETIYAVGFPASTDLAQTINTYRPDDVSIRQGTVTKAETAFQADLGDGWTYNGYWIQTTCPASGGDSGGPMVDSDGNVIGIVEAGTDQVLFAIADHSILKTLDQLNVKYTMAGDTASEGTEVEIDPAEEQAVEAEPEVFTLNTASVDAAIKDAEAKTSDGYTPESYSAMTSALSDARDASKLKLDDETDEAEYNEKQGQIDDAAKALNDAVAGLVAKPAGPSMGMIAAIAAAAIAAVALIAVLVTRNKKPAGTGTSGAPTSDVPASRPVVEERTPERSTVVVVEDKGTTVLTDDGSATTVLGSDDPATTLLSETIDGGKLTRMSTNETITINRSELSLGRERRSVDYCLEGNSNIGRVHARLIVRDGSTYIVDNNSTNGTYVNNTKLRAGVEQVLNSGDIVRLADEKFRYDK